VKMVPARVIEKAVWEQIRSWLNDPEELVREAMEAMPQVNELRRELETVEKRIAEVEKGREAVLDVLASGLFELDAKTKIKLEELKRRKIRLEQRRKEILAVLEGTEGTFSRIEELRILARNVLSKLDELEFEEKKALVRELVAQVIVAGRGKSGDNGLKDVSITVVARIPDSEKSVSSTSFSRDIR
ncbi:MAG: recombinase family protein, partial [Desulfofundulus sp.]